MLKTSITRGDENFLYTILFSSTGGLHLLAHWDIYLPIPWLMISHIKSKRTRLNSGKYHKNHTLSRANGGN